MPAIVQVLISSAVRSLVLAVRQCAPVCLHELTPAMHSGVPLHSGAEACATGHCTQNESAERRQRPALTPSSCCTALRCAVVPPSALSHLCSRGSDRSPLVATISTPASEYEAAEQHRLLQLPHSASGQHTHAAAHATVELGAIAGAPTTINLHSSADPEDSVDSESSMQRPGGMRNYSPSPANSQGGLWTTKNGTVDRHKLALLIICGALALWVVYDM